MKIPAKSHNALWLAFSLFLLLVTRAAGQSPPPRVAAPPISPSPSYEPPQPIVLVEEPTVVQRSINIDVGGQYRIRQHSERNHRGLGLTGLDDDFLLHRTRVFADAQWSDRFRTYVEYLDAESNYEDLPPRPIEVNRSDLLNLYADYMIAEPFAAPLWIRGGRQEMSYGSQRLISNLDWSNTRRTFDGVKSFWEGENWNLDSFWTRPVNVDVRNFDSPDLDQQFMGVWAEYIALDREKLELYLLRLDDNDDRREINTLGSRWTGDWDLWMAELEGGVQFGENDDGSDRSAGFVTGGIGHRFLCWCGQPEVWVYYDWASGGNDRGLARGFHHLFPLGHRYLGYMDLFGRSNIETPNILATWHLAPHLQLTTWYYYFFLENKLDTPYTVAMTPINPGNAPRSADLGHELDITLSCQITDNLNALFGYSHFFAGEYFELTPGSLYDGDAQFFYTQVTLDF